MAAEPFLGNIMTQDRHRRQRLFSPQHTKKKTWFEARDYCRAIGGDLLSIHSTDDIRVTRHGWDAWIGLSIVDPSAGWVWSDNSPLIFQHWIEGQPDNRGNSESCAHVILRMTDREGSWRDSHCEAPSDWLCQIPAGMTPKPPPNDTVTVRNVTHDGWIVWEGNQYYFQLRSMAMEDARHYCRQRHGDLVVINSEAENRFLWKQAIRYGHGFYIGLTVDLDGSYGWMDGSSVVHERWDQNQPKFLNNDENCAFMTSYMGFWHNVNCGSEYKSICKRSASAPVNTTVAPTVPPKGGCPSDWIQFDSKCYRIIHDEQNTWSGARRSCQGMNGNLVSIPSRHVQAFLITQMAGTSTTDLWIGLSAVEWHMFLWTDGKPSKYVNWHSKKGVIRSGSDFSFSNRQSTRMCVVMTKDPLLGIGTWMKTPCNNTYGYVCHRNVVPDITASTESTVLNSYVKLGNDSFKVVTQNLTWERARENCEVDGAQLVSLRNDWAQAFAELYSLSLGAPLWVGLNKQKTGGYFKFIDGWHLSSVKWGPNEPSRERPCVYIDVDGKWKTSFCNETYKSICLKSTDVPPTVSTTHQGVCPPSVDMELSGENYAWVPFRGHCYLFVTMGNFWMQASHNCVLYGGQLASIEDPAEQKFINSSLQLFGDEYDSFWIGLFKPQKGNWLWLDKTVMDYTNWEENDSGGTWGIIQVSNGKWHPKSMWNRNPYICKTAKVIPTVISPTSVHPKPVAQQHTHTALVAVLVMIALSVLVLAAFLLKKKSVRPLPAFVNPLYSIEKGSKPDVVDTKSLVENVEEENPEPIIAL